MRRGLRFNSWWSHNMTAINHSTTGCLQEKACRIALRQPKNSTQRAMSGPPATALSTRDCEVERKKQKIGRAARAGHCRAQKQSHTSTKHANRSSRRHRGGGPTHIDGLQREKLRQSLDTWCLVRPMALNRQTERLVYSICAVYQPATRVRWRNLLR